MLVLAAVSGCGGEIESGTPLADVLQPIKADDEADTDARSRRRVLLLERGGRVYRAGDDDPARGFSSLVASNGLASATVPPAPYSDAEWHQILRCVQDEYARFEVEVTDRRPATGRWAEIAIGGTGELLSFPENTGGASPFSCGPQSQGISFVFAEVWRRSLDEACETIAHEAGHLLGGLDHAFLAADPMTYLPREGHRVFQDQDAPCGESAARACICGGATQNSVQTLLKALGPRKTPPPPCDR